MAVITHRTVGEAAKLVHGHSDSPYPVQRPRDVWALPPQEVDPTPTASVQAHGIPAMYRGRPAFVCTSQRREDYCIVIARMGSAPTIARIASPFPGSWSSRRSWRMRRYNELLLLGGRLEPTRGPLVARRGRSSGFRGRVESRADSGLNVCCSRPSRRRTLNEGDSDMARAALVLTADTCGPIGGVARRKRAVRTTTYSPLRHWRNV